MSQVILSKLAPAHAAAETKASAPEEKLTGAANGQPFEDFLDARQGSIGNQPRESEAPAGQTRAQGIRKKTARAAIADQSPATASVKTLAPVATAAPDKKNVNDEALNQQGTQSPEQTNVLPAAAIEAASMQAMANQPAAPAPVVTKAENGAALAATPFAQAAGGSNTALPFPASAGIAKQTQAAANPPSGSSPGISITAVKPAAAQAAPLQAPATAQRAAPVVYAATATAAAKTPSPIVVRSAAPAAASASGDFAVTIKAASYPGAPITPPQVTISVTTASHAEPGAAPAVLSSAEAAATVPAEATDPIVPAQPQVSAPVATAASAEAAVVAMVPASAAVRGNGPAATGGSRKALAAEIAAPIVTSGMKGGGKAASPASLPEEAPAPEEVAPIGTAIAKQEHAMSQTAQFLETETYFRTSETGAVEAAPAARTQAPAVAKTIAAPQVPNSQQPLGPAAQATAFSISNSAILTEKTPSGNSTAGAYSQNLASTALNQVMEAADKMTSAGSSHVEVQVNLGDGQQLSVRLQLSQGAVHAVFKAASPEMRQAIEQNWSGFRTGASERGLQISTPVFESPSSGGNFNTFGNRNQSGQPDGELPDAEGGQPSMAKASQQTPIVPSPLAPSSAGSSVQMYA